MKIDFPPCLSVCEHLNYTQFFGLFSISWMKLIEIFESVFEITFIISNFEIYLSLNETFTRLACTFVLFLIKM